jgi:hypothetical protein
MRVDLAGQYGILALLAYNDVEIGQMNHEFVHLGLVGCSIYLIPPPTFNTCDFFPWLTVLFPLLLFWSSIDFGVLGASSAFPVVIWVTRILISTRVLNDNPHSNPLALIL